MANKIASFRQRIKKWKVPHIFKNKYVFTIFVFAIWMTFFDQNNIFVQISRMHTLRDAKDKTAYYKEQTLSTQKQLNELLTNQKSLEKYAREKYYMKKPNEDIFVIVEK